MKTFIYANELPKSLKAAKELKAKFEAKNVTFVDSPDEAELSVCIGGDGTLLTFIHDYGFPRCPIIGINSGHLGFFEEITPQQIDSFLDDYANGKYRPQEYRLIKCEIDSKGGSDVLYGLNEILVRGIPAHPINLSISVGNMFMEKFNGDGICISTNAGTTGYNYSLGGSIIDPRIDAVQITPIAPISSSSYHSINTSVIMPPNEVVTLKPMNNLNKNTHFSIFFDGKLTEYDNVRQANISVSDKKISILRFTDTTFWDRFKEKFL